jgi:hypothetical protein
MELSRRGITKNAAGNSRAMLGWREPVTFAGNSVLCARLNRRS